MDFTTLDLGTPKPTTLPQLKVQAMIDPEVIVDGYAIALTKEAERMNPLTFDRVGLTEDEMKRYSRFLLKQRVNSVLGDCPQWRRLKELYIPTFLQYVMTTVGIVDLRDRGILIEPVMADVDLTLDEALEISYKLSFFSEEIAMVKDAMPRSKEGDADTMSTALIAGYMRSLTSVEHVIATYAAAFLGLKLVEEQTLSILYRVQYDDIDRIRTALLMNSMVRGRNG